MLRKNVEKKFLYDNLDLVMLTIDEICDDGWTIQLIVSCLTRRHSFLFRIILESDPMLIIQRVLVRQDDVPIGEQTVSQVSNSTLKYSSE
jgi:hypothetical protein